MCGEAQRVSAGLAPSARCGRRMKLTKAQVAALEVLADGTEHGCWKRATDPTAVLGKGRVNTTAATTLGKLRLVRWTDYGTPFTAGAVKITDAGREALEARARR